MNRLDKLKRRNCAEYSYSFSQAIRSVFTCGLKNPRPKSDCRLLKAS